MEHCKVDKITAIKTLKETVTNIGQTRVHM